MEKPDQLISNIVKGIDRSIVIEKVTNQKRGDESCFAVEDLLKLNHGIVEGSDRYSSIWDINDFRKFLWKK